MGITSVQDTRVLDTGLDSVTLPLRNTRRSERKALFADTWMAITMLGAYIASIASFWYFFQTHQLVLYGDAYAHMLITRRVFDSATPGIAQLGGVWLPLPHLVMLPFMWNDYLWRTGLAGALPSMICYLIAARYLFLATRRLTKNSVASFVGTLVFILNPNVLYLQTTALTEIVLIATLTACSYYFLAWAQEGKINDLILAAFTTFLSTLARYDGWFLFVALLVVIIPIGLLKRKSRAQIESDLIVFGSLGGLGIVLWLIWERLIFGDPLFFQRGPFSSQAMQRALIDAHVLFTYHDLWQSFRYYTIDSLQNVGPLVFALSILAVGIFIVRRRLSPEMLAGLVFLAPFAFYVISLYGGQAAIYTSQAVPPDFEHQIYNARYGVEMVAPCALFIATLACLFTRSWLRICLPVALVGVILVQSVLTARGGIISLQDGQFGVSCSHTHPTVLFLAQHYNGGMILEDLYDTKIDALNPEASINFRSIIYEGSGPLWKQALHSPATTADWVIVNPADPHDMVARSINPLFNAQFTRDIEEPDGLSLYHRNGLSFPTRPVPTFYLTQHALCGTNEATQAAALNHQASRSVRYGDPENTTSFRMREEN